MKRPTKSGVQKRIASEEILAEYDFSKAMPNKYASRYATGSSVVVLEPDVAAPSPVRAKLTRHCAPWRRSSRNIERARHGRAGADGPHQIASRRQSLAKARNAKKSITAVRARCWSEGPTTSPLWS